MGPPVAILPGALDEKDDERLSQSHSFIQSVSHSVAFLKFFYSCRQKEKRKTKESPALRHSEQALGRLTNRCFLPFFFSPAIPRQFDRVRFNCPAAAGGAFLAEPLWPLLPFSPLASTLSL